MRDHARYLWGALRREYALGATPEVARVFLVCVSCGRVVPQYHAIVAKCRPGHRLGCRCGGDKVRPATIASWKAAWWVLVRGLLIRRLILRMHSQSDWDARMPVRG